MTTKKQLIINADDFGISKSANLAILKAAKDGVLTSASLMANAPAFEDAVSILEQLEGISIGVHLNIIEFSTLKEKLKHNSLLYDENGQYKNGFVQILLKSFNEGFLEEVERDFRLQIEKILEKTKVSHIDSHVHVHAIPGIFRIACKLAKEYGIKNIRTQFEIPYLVPDISKYISFKYPINLIKVALLNSFTLINWRCAKEFGLSTNENLIGVNYTGYMDNKTIEFALKNVKSLTELLLHPSISSEKSSGYKEFLAVADTSLNDRLKTADITAVGWK